MRIAVQLKSQGDFDLFRGQVRNFPVKPTLFRANVDTTVEIERLNRFADWVGRVPEIESLHMNAQAILATAQHYGFRTTLLDFTTSPKVAGYFASSIPPPPVVDAEHEPSCIVCANREQLEKSWEDLNKRSRALGNPDLVKVIEIDVRNLWRLQAQEDLFLYIHVDHIML